VPRKTKKKATHKRVATTFATGRVLVGSCLDELKQLGDGSIDSIVTDPPYELGFMGKKWDASGIAYNVELWRECLRVLKPGGHLLAFGGTRTYHRMTVAIEDAGFEIRDSIHWVYGSGFPKSLNVAKAVEAHATTGSSNKTQFKNLTGEKVKRGNWGIAKQQHTHGQRDTNYDETAGDTRLGELAPTTDAAKQWDGWGTALKPAHEPIVLARKPLDGTVAANVLEHGTGAINIDGCRVGCGTGEARTINRPDLRSGNYGQGKIKHNERESLPQQYVDRGRWPANIIFDEAAGAELDEQSGITTSGAAGKKGSSGFAGNYDGEYTVPYGDTGGASRFFYCPKPSKAERNAGLDKLQKADTPGVYAGRVDGSIDGHKTTPRQNFHPTVKPVELMCYLVRLITPPNGTVLDPFLGSGTTAVAAILEGYTWIGCEMTRDYLPIIRGRIKWAQKQQPKLPGT
jgi:site-specific DNA-methyltransferase (adenine-specific)